MSESNPLRFLGIPHSMALIIISIADVFIMFMPTIGYLDTVRIMIKSQSSTAFPYNTCLILLASHGLKVIYFIYHPYAVRLFGQSATQIGAAFLMAYVKFYYSAKNYKPRRRSSINSLKKEIQMQKSNFMYYLYIRNTKNFFEFTLSIVLYTILTLFAFLFSYNILGEQLTIDSIGVLANLIESTVSIPIFIKIVIKKDISNISTLLIAQFVLGDLMKLTLFIINQAPLSFIGGSLLQMSLDLTLFAFYLQLSFCAKQDNSENELLIENKKFNDDISIDSANTNTPHEFDIIKI